MAKTLRAMILGSGYAGQGHAMALRECGVEIAAMASRTEEVVRRVAAEMGIPVASTDWRATLAEVRPEIVAVGTPGGTHVEMVGAALAAGCHVLCDKPLATTAAEARSLAEQAEAAGVKTAYAASYRYQPAALLARELVAAGAIGTVCEAECISHYNWPLLASFGWPHRLDTGGGRMNNNFTHKLAIVLQALSGQALGVGRWALGVGDDDRPPTTDDRSRPNTQGPRPKDPRPTPHAPRPTVLSAMGEARNDLKRVPVGPPVHDFREFNRKALTPEEAAAAEWREVDSDWSYTVLARIGPPGTDPAEGVSATFRHSALRAGRLEDYVAFYGTEGTLHIRGAYAQGPLFRRGPGRTAEWEEIPIPAHMTEALPAISNDTQRNWTQLCREFVADIRGEGDAGYHTFHDGWLFQEVIDIVRSGRGWARVPTGLS
jgi:predicted dehydrogenase